MNKHNKITRTEIQRAYSFMEEGKHQAGMQAFALARTLVVELADPERLSEVLANDERTHVTEREYYRELILDQANPAENPSILILSDSLGLPSRKAEPNKGVEMMYPWLLSKGAGKYRVNAMCQRYMTSRTALNLIKAQPGLAKTDRAILHFGINDRAIRMFMADERLALSLLPDDLSKLFIEFVRKYRRPILKHLPWRQYVEQKEFRQNVEEIIILLRSAGVKRIVISTILFTLPGMWAGNPANSENLTRHNLELIQAAAKSDARLFDFDRLIWAAGIDSHVTTDGIHLTAAGHRLFANQVPLMFR